MEDSNVPSPVPLNDDSGSKKQDGGSGESIDKPAQTVNGGNRAVPNDRKFYPGKTMHVMTPGPKKYQHIKRSPDKEPKFVPYEPYKAAVRSIVPELGKPSVAVFKRRLSTASNCSKVSNNIAETDKEDVITNLTREKQVIDLICKYIYYVLYIPRWVYFFSEP